MSAAERSLAPVIEPGQSYKAVNDQISAIVLGTSRRGWFVMIGCAAIVSLLLIYAVTLVFTVGVGMLGVNMPVAWGAPIVNVVWWIGIGHAGKGRRVERGVAAAARQFPRARARRRGALRPRPGRRGGSRIGISSTSSRSFCFPSFI